MPDETPKARVLKPERNISVEVDNISKRFGRFTAIENVSFDVREGEVLGFLGPNGAGKTTTVRVLTGYFPPSSGVIRIGGKLFSDDPESAKRKIGYLPETISLYPDMRVIELLTWVAQIKGVMRERRKGHIDDILAKCSLQDVRKKLIGYLSKGYRQRVGLAQALIGDPEVLILDEPTNGLDPKQIYEIRALIQDLGRERTLILSSHILPEVSMVCDRILIMNQGRVVASGTAHELEAGLKKVQEIFIVIGDALRKDEATTLLKALSGVESVQVTQESSGQVSFSLAVSKDHDLRAEISKLFVEHQIPLLEIRSGHLSLEEIFMKIVVSEERKLN